MKLFYAHYPSLENRFVKFVKTERTSSLDKWLVVGASSWINKRLQARLAAELGVVANIHFTTLSGVLGRLTQEDSAPALPLFPQDHLRDFLIKEILTEPGLNRYPVSRGFVQAVKSALRDLADSLAAPDVLEEQASSMSDFAREADGGHFDWLIRLYRRYCEKEKSIPGYRSYQQAFEAALEQVETSAYLHEFSHIIVYGFYDMPGRQLELVSRLKLSYPITVFAPYSTHPAYRFAKKFFENNWLSAPGAENVEQPVPLALGKAAPFLFASEGSAAPNRLTRQEVPDSAGAVFFVAKEILRLQKEEHIAPDKIAVIARTITPYQDEIRRVFAENCIALDTSFTYPLSKYSLGKFCMTALSLGQQGFARDKVMAVFSSPYFKPAEKNNWLQAVRRCAVNRDVSQWKDLLSQTTGSQAEVWHWIKTTAKQLDELAAPQPWQTGVERALAFLDNLTDRSSFKGKDAEIYQKMREAVSKMSVYAAIRAQSKPGELIQEILDTLAALTFNEVQSMPGGVIVTDAIRARGLSFHTVFVLGLNDTEFPLLAQEDPILRDYYRFILRDTLGYWINASLDRIDEERLLFYTTLTTATDNLYVLSARKTADGKPAVPSIYVAELARASEQPMQPDEVHRLSGYLSEQLAACPLEFLTPKELSYRFILHPDTAEKNYREAGILTPEKSVSLTAARAVAASGSLGVFDGLVSYGPQLFERENAKGFSPSALQELGSCPFKYFAKRVLCLAEPDPLLSRQELAANEKGSAMHAILREFYETLGTQQLADGLFDSAVEEYISRAVAKTYPKDAYKRFGIYPVVWELLVEQIRQTLVKFAQEDAKHLDGFLPTYFEQEAVAEPTEGLPLRLHGFIDRIDINSAQQTLRIVDYKSTRKGTANLARDLFTRLTLQPFLYWLMVLQLNFLKKYTPKEACLFTLAQYKKQTLVADEFNAVYEDACRLLKLLSAFIKQGTFFINPSDACTYCPYALLCRKDAFKPLFRARKSKPATALEEARQ